MFKIYKVPKQDEDEPTFCHNCGFQFAEMMDCYIDIDVAEMLCKPCIIQRRKEEDTYVQHR